MAHVSHLKHGSRLHSLAAVHKSSIDPDTERLRSYSVWCQPEKSAKTHHVGEGAAELELRLMNGKGDRHEGQCKNRHGGTSKPHPGPAQRCVRIQYGRMRQP